MSSSSSSGYSDEDSEGACPTAAAAPPATDLAQSVELAQICSFCATFRAPLRLPSFSRTDLQEAIQGASNGDTTHTELLAELHFKLAREHPTAKMEKMVQDWEKTLARKLQDNWRKEFTVNPMGGGTTYRQLTVIERVKVLDALCHWKLDTCAEIHKHIATAQKENDNEAIKRLRAGEIGTDDKGVSYWYFDDGCWIYAEDQPRWQLEERKPTYLVEYASAKKIRLSINFDPDHNSSAPPIRLPLKSVAFSDEIKEEKKVKQEALPKAEKDGKSKSHSASGSVVKNEGVTSEAVKMETTELVKAEKQEAPSDIVTEGASSVDGTIASVKGEGSSDPPTPTARRMDISVLCATVSPSSEDAERKRGEHASSDSQHSNGSAKKHDGEIASKAVVTEDTCSQSSAKVEEGSTTSAGTGSKTSTGSNEKDITSQSPGKRSLEKINEDNSGNHTHPSVVAVVGSKKRTIIDDDSSDGSNSDADTATATTDKKVELHAATSPPPKKKRKTSFEDTSKATILDTKTSSDGSPKLSSAQINGERIPQASKVKDDTKTAKESSVVAPTTVMDVEGASSSLTEAKASTTGEVKEVLPSSTSTEVPEVTPKIDEVSNAASKKAGDVAIALAPSGLASVSPTDPAAAPESFDITCESCKKSYDMRYVDPPLVERPADEWRCFECLVNDARGWPRRRKSTPREPFSPRGNGREESSRKRSSSSKSRSGSSSSKKSKKISSKSRSSSSSRKKSSHSSSSKRKSSSSKSSSSKKSSSSSSSKKHKKRKSSSSSHHHHSSSHGHRRRHHSHSHHEEFAKLVGLYRERHEQRLGIEEARISGDLHIAPEETPQNWRVVSSTLDDMRALIQALSGGSLEQDRLRGRLIVILKDQEKFEEQRRKQQELAWNILPRRQSSRIAIGRMKNQSAQESDAEQGYSDDDVDSRRPGLRSRRAHSTPSDGVEQKHDRAWRARRRHQGSDDDMDLDDEDDEADSNGAGKWIDWTLLKQGNIRCLSTVCLAFVNRLLKEEASDLFSRPVDPELDGCPNYLSVIEHPMDLGTIRSRVEGSFYRKWELFKKDVELVWQNCRTFNAPDTMVVQFADLLSKLSRSMCIAAEKNGVSRMKDKGSEGGESDHDSEENMSDVSKAESRGSVNKAWTESSASESSDSTNGDSSSDGGDSDSDARNRKRRSSRTSSKKPQTRARPTRSSRASRPASTRASRSTRSRSSKKRSAPTSSSGESSASGDDEVFSPVRQSRRQFRGTSGGKVDPPTEDEDSSDGDNVNNRRPPPPQNGAPSPSPPPPPPPQALQKRPKPRLVISDTSSSDGSSDSSSSSSSSDSDDSDSDSRPASKRPQPPPPSAADAPAPPPPSPPPPAASPVDNKPPVRSSPSNKAKPKKTAAKKAKSPSAAKTGAAPGYSSPPLLNSYLSPSSSSSSDFSSGDSDSSDGDSDSD